MPLACRHPHLYGLDDNHLINIEKTKLTQATANAYVKMKHAIIKDGLNIAICSGFRSFDRQCQIWNAKAEGSRPVLDRHNQSMDIRHYSEHKLMKLILTWSALPGCSRHHWGTDIDIYDPDSIDINNLQLINQEYELQGPCYQLHQWLTKNASSYGFFFPFKQGLSGVQMEKWHISYYDEANLLLNQFSKQDLQQLIQQSNIKLKSSISKNLSNIIKEYVYRIAPFPVKINE